MSKDLERICHVSSAGTTDMKQKERIWQHVSFPGGEGEVRGEMGVGSVLSSQSVLRCSACRYRSVGWGSCMTSATVTVSNSRYTIAAFT